MEADLPVHPDLPKWFSAFYSEYANTKDDAYGSVVAHADGWRVYVRLANLERFEGFFPTAAEAVQAIVDYVAANTKSGVR